jgi:hypothetical protein
VKALLSHFSASSNATKIKMERELKSAIVLKKRWCSLLDYTVGIDWMTVAVVVVLGTLISIAVTQEVDCWWSNDYSKNTASDAAHRMIVFADSVLFFNIFVFAPLIGYTGAQ